MTARNPFDCYLTPPCASLALRTWLLDHEPSALTGWHWLDMFGGPGQMVSLVVGGVEPDPGARLRTHAWELDPTWRTEMGVNILASRMRAGYDSFAHGWVVDGRHAPHVVTNPPYLRTPEAVARLHDHSREHNRVVCALLRTDWWQHEGRFATHAPDALLMLSWRPSFGWRWDEKAQRLVWSTDRFTGYSWAVWRGSVVRETTLAMLAKPDVPKGLVAEHKRLCRVAFEASARAAA